MERIHLEHQRLQSLAPSPAPSAGMLVADVTITAEAGVDAVLERARSVLAVVDERVLAGGAIDDEAWQRAIPEWFRGACSPPMSSAEAEVDLARWRAMSHQEKAEEDDRRAWELDNWLYWFQPENRGWYWLGARLMPNGGAVLTVEVEGSPFPDGALRWLIRAAGARRVDVE